MGIREWGNRVTRGGEVRYKWESVNGSQFETVNLRKQVLSRLGVFYKDLKTGDGFANTHWEQLGRSTADMHGERWIEYVHPDDRDRVREALERHLRGETPEFQAEYRVRDRDGSYRWFISSGMVERRDSGSTPVTYVGHDQDVTDLHTLREALQESRQEAEERASEAEALRGAGAVVVASLDAPTAVRSVVEQLNTLVAFDSALVCELENRQLRYVGGSSDITANNWRAFARTRRRAFLTVIQSRIPYSVDEQNSATGARPRTTPSDDGLPYKLFVPLVARGSAVGVLAISRSDVPFAGEEVRIAMSMADYLSLALSNARLYSHMQQRAEIDQLTGVLTRRAFMESGEQVMDQAFHAAKPLCAFILDIDHFKPINDTFGHPAGDQVLRTLGAVMRDSLRSTDMIGRFGGEEFCALLTDTEYRDGRDVAERLRRAIESTAFAGINRQVTASIGIAYLPPGGGSDAGETAEQHRQRLSIEQIIQRADIALYNAKESGRNRVIAYEEGMRGE